MKKILFTLLSALALFSSCSSDNDTFTENVSDSNNEPKYTVNFDIKSDAFEVDKTPLRSYAGDPSHKNVLQIVVYKESGEVYSDTVIIEPSDLNTNQAYPFSADLPPGNYHFAMMYTSLYIVPTRIYNYSIDNLKLHPQNYFSDIYGASGLGELMGGDGANTGNYYQTFTLSVPSTTQESIPVVLEPMWSRVDIVINDAQNFLTPYNATEMEIDVLPSYHRYSLSTKLAVEESSHDWRGLKRIQTASIKDQDVLSISFNISKTKAENNALKLLIRFYQQPSNALVSEHLIDLNTQVENGLNYVVKGKGNFLEFAGASMGVTFEPFNDDESINLPFE